MGIYDKAVKEKLIKEEGLIEKPITIELEIYVDSGIYESIVENSIILYENMSGYINLNNGKNKVKLLIRDKTTVTANGGNKHVESCSLKIVGPLPYSNKNGVDIIIPPFVKDGEKPYKDAKTPGHDKSEVFIDSNAKVNENDPVIKLGIKFAKENKKILRLLYQKPENEPNQYKLFSQLISNCDYIEDFTFNDKEKNKMLHDKFDNRSE